MASEDTNSNSDPMLPAGFGSEAQKPSSPPPVSQSTPGEPQGLNPQPLPPKGKGSRKKLFLVAGGLLVVVALLVSGWLYYTNPQKVMADALAQTIESEASGYKGKIEFATKGETPVKVTVDFSGEGDRTNAKLDAKTKISYEAVDVNVDTSFLAVNNQAYFKLNNAKQLANLAASTSEDAKSAVEIYKPLIEKIDGKWIKVDQQGESDDQVSKCSQALSTLKVTDADQKAIKKLFHDNQFVKATNAGGGSFTEGHYKLSLDEKKAEKFFEETLKLDSFKKLKADCNVDTTAKDVKEETAKGDDMNFTTELWANKLSHTPSKLTTTGENKDMKLSFTTDIKLDQKVSVSAPKDAMPLSDIIKEFQTELLKQFSGDPATEQTLEQELQTSTQ